MKVYILWHKGTYDDPDEIESVFTSKNSLVNYRDEMIRDSNGLYKKNNFRMEEFDADPKYGVANVTELDIERCYGSYEAFTFENCINDHNGKSDACLFFLTDIYRFTSRNPKDGEGWSVEITWDNIDNFDNIWPLHYNREEETVECFEFFENDFHPNFIISKKASPNMKIVLEHRVHELSCIELAIWKDEEVEKARIARQNHGWCR